MKQNVALVMSSGGARGMAHIGVMEELQKSGFKITSIAGSSIGALIGGVFASGKLEEFSDWVGDVSRMDIFKLMDFAISKRGFIKGEKVFRKIKKYIGDVKIEDLPIPYAAIAADIENHQEIVFTSGSLINAIRASVSIPTIFLPYNIDGIDLIDGGMINPLPLNRVKRNDDDILIAVNLNSPQKYIKPVQDNKQEQNESVFYSMRKNINRKWSKFFNIKEKNKKMGFFDLLTGSFALMQDSISEYAIEQYKPDFIIDISRHSCDTLEFYKADELIEVGRKACKEALGKYLNPPADKGSFPAPWGVNKHSI